MTDNADKKPIRRHREGLVVMRKLLLSTALVAAMAVEAQAFDGMDPTVYGALSQRAASYGMRALDLYWRIPYAVRSRGPGYILPWIKGRDVSHIMPRSTHPHMAGNPGNVVWERSYLNRARGPRPMTRSEVFRARADHSIGGRAHSGYLSWLQGAGSLARVFSMGVLAGALVEAPVSIAEQTLLALRHDKDSWRALEAAVKSIGLAAIAGGSVNVMVTVAAPVLATVPGLAVTAAIVGVVVYGVYAAYRLYQAWEGSEASFDSFLSNTEKAYDKWSEEQLRVWVDKIPDVFDNFKGRVNRSKEEAVDWGNEQLRSLKPWYRTIWD